MARLALSPLDDASPPHTRFVVAGLAGDPSDQSTLEAAAALARSHLGEVHALHVESGADGVTHADLELARASDELGAEFLVIGKRSAPTSRGRGAPGTTTRGLLAEPHHPLWLQRGAWSPPDRILAAIDDPERDRGVLARAHDLAARFRASLVVVHCQETGRPAESTRDRKWFERWALEQLGEARVADVQVLHLVGPPVRALADHIERADLAVLGRGSRQGLGRVLHDAVATRRGPLLVVPVSA
jgi:nucleotide-binding universal stress UspA family protein